MVLNDELTPVKPKEWMPGGELMTVEKVDEYTIRLKFAVPHPLLYSFSSLARSRRNVLLSQALL